ncbi:MAG TPA: adenylate/guanylate cyclase domain-containing protein [Steroidobacteraceae bacterium]|nr:adenylate/guanylate cyclase domain-containing protein [Steroidobacteraceae bacterium]
MGCAVVATPRDASKQGGQNRVRTPSAAARSSSQRSSHRRQLLRAIAELPSGAKDAPKVAAATAPPTASQDTAERRQVTVMFSDLVGSTALSARTDPEDLREVISAYQKCVAETVQRFGGFVARYMGDGVLVYFGYPQAHEDDAERAVRAGLELVGLSMRSSQTLPYKPVSASRPGSSWSAI